jgi:hypothetical protein
LNEALQRAEIQRYVQKAFLAKIMHMNEDRERRKGETLAQLSNRGYSRNSSAWMISEIDIEEECIANLLLQKADLYLDAYERRGLKIGPDVLKDIAHSQVEITAARKSSLIGQAQLIGVRTNRPQNMTGYGHLGKRASVAMKDIEAKIDLYNLTPKKAEPMTINNTTYHLSGVGNRVVHGDDNSVNVINEKELFDQLASVITSAVHDATERQSILEKLDELKREKNKTDYLTKLAKFLAAAGPIAHFIGPYLPALAEKASSLL